MNTPPFVSKAMIESRQRDLLAQAGQARMIREAQQARRAAAARPEAVAGATAPVARRRWSWQVRLAALLRAG